jgi:hypothetical protein
MNAPQTLKIACPSCAGHVEFPAEMRGQIINCPHCGLSVVLELPGAPARPLAPPTPPAAPVVPNPAPHPALQFQRTAKFSEKKRDDGGWGVVIQLLGFFLLFAFPIGTVIGIGLLIVGGMLARRFHCVNCGHRAEKSQALCAHCGAIFQ